MKKLILPPGSLLLVLLLTLTGCDTAGPVGETDVSQLVYSRPADSRPEVPFKGSCTTVLGEPVPVFKDGAFIGLDLPAEGTCRLTHLGRSHVETLVRYRPAACVAGVCTTSSTVTFTAANGDRLVVEGTSNGIPASVPPVFSFVSLGTITGGTGRFSDASGTLETEVFVNQIEKRGYFEYDGTFSY